MTFDFPRRFLRPLLAGGLVELAPTPLALRRDAATVSVEVAEWSEALTSLAHVAAPRADLRHAGLPMAFAQFASLAHDALWLTDPRLDEASELRDAAQQSFDAALAGLAPVTTHAEAVARAVLVDRLEHVQRDDVSVRTWITDLGGPELRAHGTLPPPRWQMLPTVRRVRTEKQRRSLRDFTPPRGEAALTAVARFASRSPLTRLERWLDSPTPTVDADAEAMAIWSSPGLRGPLVERWAAHASALPTLGRWLEQMPVGAARKVAAEVACDLVALLALRGASTVAPSHDREHVAFALGVVERMTTDWGFTDRLAARDRAPVEAFVRVYGATTTTATRLAAEAFLRAPRSPNNGRE